MIADIFGVRNQTEVLIIITIAIALLSSDDSPSKINENLEEVWNFDLGEEIRKKHMEIPLRHVLATVIVIRAFTSRVFLLLYVVMLWPAIFRTKPHLMVPWLALGLLRSVLLTLLTLLTGSYVCLVQKGFDCICLEYIVAQYVDHGPAVYAWFSMLSYYQELYYEVPKSSSKPKYSYSVRTNYVKFADRQKFITETNVINFIINLKKLEPWDLPTRSLDSLLTLPSSKVKGKEPGKNIADYVKNVLSIVDEDIERAKMEKCCRGETNSLPIEKVDKLCNTSHKLGRKFVEEFVENEIELKCVSLEESAHSVIVQHFDNITKKHPHPHGKETTKLNTDFKSVKHFGCQVNTLCRKFAQHIS
ncbi:hypothetical protein JTB14_029821 [Gonioctena quinquepunctata]|nr:hypothetical protein JTB14_029821 [Gonioctena quinquepunctata]